MRLLIAEDDSFLASGLLLALQDSGYTVDHVTNGLDADIAVATTGYDLLILDLGLPKLDGLDVLRNMRKRGIPTPVLILSARDTIEERVKGLDCGANDYLVKPFHLSELEARIRALLRKGFSNQTLIECGNVQFDTSSRTVLADGKPVELSPRELAVLEVLLQHRNSVVSKEMIADHLSSWESELTYNAIDIAVHRMRRKLEPHGFKLKTMRGIGYVVE